MWHQRVTLEWKPSIVIGVDFGTSRSGFAVGFPTEPHPRTKVVWDDGYTRYPKASTVLLYSRPAGDETPRLTEDDSGKPCWGFSATRRHAHLTDVDRWRYYLSPPHFKMQLKDYKGQQDILVDYGDRRFSLEMLISDILRCLREDAVQHTPELHQGDTKTSEVRWCLSVPAIWTEDACVFMRRAAYKAGLIEKSEIEIDEKARLVIVREPDAAALSLRLAERTNAALVPGVRFMIFDAGGGTIDTTCYEVQQDGRFAQVANSWQAAGNDCGSTRIDRDFYKYFCDALKLPDLDTIRKHCSAGYYHLMGQWENVKLSFKPTRSDEIYKPAFGDDLRHYLQTTYPEALRALATHQQGRDGSLWVNAEEMKALFKGAVEGALRAADRAFTEDMGAGCHYIFLAGGFSHCEHLQQSLRAAFKDRLEPPPGSHALPEQVHIMEEPGAAIVKGAALFGLDPNQIPVRRSLVTVAQSVYMLHDDLDAENDKPKLRIANRDYCPDRLNILIQRGALVNNIQPKPVRVTVRTPVRNVDGNSFVHFAPVNFYLVPEREPRYVESRFQDIGTEYVRVQFDADGIGHIEVYFSFQVANNLFRIEIKDLATGEEACPPVCRHLSTSFFLDI